MKRPFDLLFALLLFICFLPLFVFVLFLVKITSKGPGLYWSDRVGQKNKIFSMPKFRSMNITTPIVATHLLKESKTHLTLIGDLLRKSSVDELPQLISIMKGDMSFVGPRPALYNQYDLIEMRTQKKIHLIKPGLTGYAQIMGRDDIDIKQKVVFDFYYYQNRCLLLDLQILVKTFFKVIKRDGVRH